MNRSQSVITIIGYIALEMLYSGMNFQDLMVRQGAVDNPPKTPFTLGFECSGEIEALGDNVQGFQVRSK